MAGRTLLVACVVVCLGFLSRGFVSQGGRLSSAPAESQRSSFGQAAPSLSAELPEQETAFSWDGFFRVAAGFTLSLALMLADAGLARADIEDVVISVDDKGKTTNLTKEGVVRGKRLFLAACASCHVGGGTRTNQNVGLSAEELAGANPARDNISELVKYLNEPMTYDGLKDISETHPSVKAADVWPKMRSMNQQDLYDMSLYILYQGITIPEKWGGGKIY